MNPYENFEDLYGQDQMTKYSASLENPPHVYAIGNIVFIIFFK